MSPAVMARESREALKARVAEALQSPVVLQLWSTLARKARAA